MKKGITRILCAGLILATAVSFSGCKKKEVSDSNVKTITIWSANGHNKDYYTLKVEEFNSGFGKKHGS